MEICGSASYAANRVPAASMVKRSHCNRMTDTSANPLRTLNAHWMTEHTFYVLVFVGVAVLACIKPIAGIAAALGVIAGTALVGRMRTGIVVFAAMIPFDLQIPIGFEQPLYLDLFFGLLAIPILVDLIRSEE